MTLQLIVEIWHIDWHWSLILSWYFLIELLDDRSLSWLYLVSIRGLAYVFHLFLLYLQRFSFHFTRLIYFFYAFMDNLPFSFCMTRIEGDGERWRWFVIETTWGGLSKLALGSWRHKDYGFEHRDTYCSFYNPIWCFCNISPWAPMKGISIPLKWKVTKSSSKIYVWFNTFNDIQPWNYSLSLHSVWRINMWFFTNRVWWCF